jgi:hypothetical protein
VFRKDLLRQILTKKVFFITTTKFVKEPKNIYNPKILTNVNKVIIKINQILIIFNNLEFLLKEKNDIGKCIVVRIILCFLIL